jgi:putative tricarboxylic transport membrane protein
MHTRRRRTIAGFAAGVPLAACAMAALPQAQVKGLEIVAPASPGGGWDQTARPRAMQQVLQEAGLASGV